MTDNADLIFELPDERVEYRVDAPALLIDAAARAGVVLNVACGGKGACGGCAVDLLEGRFVDRDGKAVDIPAGAAKRALACQTRVLGGSARLRVPRHSLVEAGEKIVMDFAHAPQVQTRPAVRKEYLQLPKPTLADQRGDLERIIDGLRRRGYEGPILSSVYIARASEFVTGADYELTVTATSEKGGWHIIRLEPGDTTASSYGAAVDIGTTTVVVGLVDLNTGEIVDAASSYNQQVIRCDDVASRISYAADRERVEELRDLIVDGTIDRLLRLLLRGRGLSADDIAHMVVAGNTVMTHLFCGMSPAGLGGVPFAPVSNFPGPYRAGQLHLDMNPEGFVDVYPSSAAYVGGDITADMFMCGIGQASELTVLIDIGTNAEIIVGNRDRLIACAAPAGPAFEGHGLAAGMRAATGAIESIAFDGLASPPTCTVIGEAKPAGICGSGLIDFVAGAFTAGILTAAGRFSDAAVAGCERVGKIAQGDTEMLAYEIAAAEDTDDGLAPLVITERDVAALMQAKGVIFAALQIALKHFGKGFADIGRFYLAGGFARHIDLDNAVTMGLLPDIDRERYVFIGNGSMGGAYLALVDQAIREHLPKLAAAPTVIELNLDPGFMDAYTMAMFLPNGDATLFPSVGGGK